MLALLALSCAEERAREDACTDCSGIHPSGILDPRSTWADKDDYDRTAHKLVQLFVDNFAQFEAHVDEGVRNAAPVAA